jgi:hypothetical protein
MKDAKMGTGYAIPNFHKLIAAFHRQLHAQHSAITWLAPPFEKLGIA